MQILRLKIRNHFVFQDPLLIMMSDETRDDEWRSDLSNATNTLSNLFPIYQNQIL